MTAQHPSLGPMPGPWLSLCRGRGRRQVDNLECAAGGEGVKDRSVKGGRRLDGTGGHQDCLARELHIVRCDVLRHYVLVRPDGCVGMGPGLSAGGFAGGTVRGGQESRGDHGS